MSKKSFHIEYNAKVVIVFVLLSAVIMLANMVSKNVIVPLLFTSPAKGSFDFKNVVHYVRLFTHVLSHVSWQEFFVNSLAILLLGTVLEERYGSLILTLMIFVTALVTGVLTATLSPTSTSGATCIVLLFCMLLFTNAFTKKSLELSSIAFCILYLAYLFYATEKNATTVHEGGKLVSRFLQKNIPTFISLAGGIVGSLFAFLPSPAKKTQKPKKEKPASEAKKPSWKSESDETVIGTIEL